jgi:hypothetical protein
VPQCKSNAKSIKKSKNSLFLSGFNVLYENIKDFARHCHAHFLTACANQNRNILSDGSGNSQLQTRSIQTRSFDTGDKNLVVRNVIATLQDLGFVIDKADVDLGTIIATRLTGYQIIMSVTARNKGVEEMIKRANCQYNDHVILDPVLYQDFFSALQKSLFLTANSVE